MKLDELIGKLVAERALHGNIEVIYMQDLCYYASVEKVEYKKPSHSMEEERIELS